MAITTRCNPMPPTPQSFGKTPAIDIRIVATLAAVSAVVIITGLIWLWASLSDHTGASGTVAYALTCALITLSALAYTVRVKLDARKNHAKEQQLQTTLTQLKAIWDYAPLSMQNTQILHCEYRIVHKDGTWIWALVRGKALLVQTAIPAAWSSP